MVALRRAESTAKTLFRAFYRIQEVESAAVGQSTDFSKVYAVDQSMHQMSSITQAPLRQVVD
jgi:hypothetical protein